MNWHRRLFPDRLLCLWAAHAFGVILGLMGARLPRFNDWFPLTTLLVLLSFSFIWALYWVFTHKDAG